MPQFFWMANHHGLDLLNTEVADQHGDAVDLLRSPADLLDWIDLAGLAPRARLDEAGARTGYLALRPPAADMEDEAAGLAPQPRLDDARARAADPNLDELLGWTRRLRATARQLLDPAVGATEDAVHQLDAIVGTVPVRLAHPDLATDPPLASRGDIYDALRLPLAWVVLDALQLDKTYVRRCGGDRCILLFYDTSRTRSRRWCDMAICGNRAKAAAHYHRRKQSTH